MSKRTYKSLQVCRVIAGMLVVLYHMGTAFGSEKYFGAKIIEAVMSVGHHSVVFFFVLSGFTVVEQHFEDFGRPQRLLNYCSKRAIRVYPAFLMIVASVYLIARIIPSLSQTVPHDPWVLLRTALLLPQDRQLVGGSGAPILIVAWSMQYEMVFYALIASLIFSRFVGAMLVIALLINFGACKLQVSCEFPREFLASNFIVPFFFGAAIAVCHRHGLRMVNPMRLAYGAISVWALLRGLEASFDLNLSLITGGVLVYGILASLIIVSLVVAEDVAPFNVHPYWEQLASSSYVLYLIHFPIISVMCKAIMAIGMTQSIPLCMAFIGIFLLCICAARWFHLCLERPLVGYLLRLHYQGGEMKELLSASSDA